MSYSIIIPAQEVNKYHKLGDLASFGATTLLEWKITQCKEFVNDSQIYITSDSEKIEAIAVSENVNFIKRESNQDYQEMVTSTLKQVDCENIMWLNATSPFINSSVYKDMYNEFVDTNAMSLVSVEKKSEYIFYKDEKLNFSDDFSPRTQIEPVYIMTNGCSIVNREEAIQHNNLVLVSPVLYELDSFASNEIKDMSDYKMARDLISVYFKREVNV